MPRIRIALAVALALAGCGKVHAPPSSGPATGTVCPEGGTPLRYADFQLQFFGDAAGTTGYCNYCHHSSRTTPDARHGADPRVTLDLVEVIRSFALQIDSAAGKGPTPTTPVMPYVFPSPKPVGVPDPQPVPTDQEREALSVWLACGAP